MHQSSALTRFVSILVANRKATNRQTVAYTVVKEANSMPVFDSWGRLHSSAWTFAVPRVGHGTIGKNACCRAVREGLAVTLAISVQEATSGSRDSLEQT